MKGYTQRIGITDTMATVYLITLVFNAAAAASDVYAPDVEFMIEPKLLDVFK